MKSGKQESESLPSHSGITSKSLAKFLGIDQKTLRKFETGKGKPSETLQQDCARFPQDVTLCPDGLRYDLRCELSLHQFILYRAHSRQPTKPQMNIRNLGEVSVSL